MPLTTNQLIIPDWPAPKNIQAFTTTRNGGVSVAPYDSLNLGFHVNDKPAHVAENIKLVEHALGGNAKVNWMSQVHGVEVFNAQEVESEVSKGDAMHTALENQACSILTADCLPVLFCDKQGFEIAAAHAGWKGLAAGIISQTLKSFSAKPSDILVWLGPAIGENAFEVGEDVKHAFINSLSDTSELKEIERAFVVKGDGKYLANLYHLARLELVARGVTNIYGGGFCTYTDPKFYSYRRDVVTGRMATMIVRHKI